MNADSMALADWGKPLSEYGRNPQVEREMFLSGGVAIAMGVIVMTVGVIQLMEDAAFWFLILIGFLVALPGILIFVGTRRRRTLRVKIFSEGFSYALGHKLERAQWSNVESITFMIVKGRRRQDIGYFVRMLDGKQYFFNRKMENLKLLGEAIQYHAYPHILPRLQQAFNAGETLVFSNLSVNKTTGLSYQNKNLGWQEVSGVSLQNNVLTIGQKSQRTPFVCVSCIPNVVLLMMLLKQRGL